MIVNTHFLHMIMKLHFLLLALAAVHAKTDREAKTDYHDIVASDLEIETFWERELQSSLSKLKRIMTYLCKTFT